uniref:Uncharacterized protein n=1 Tax=Heterorhabditis bacteriophora TaxID=37862 RepID=A0A1I7WCJ4_HETBA
MTKKNNSNQFSNRWLSTSIRCSEVAYRLPVWFSSSLGTSTGVDCGITLLESEANTWKSLKIRD